MPLRGIAAAVPGRAGRRGRHRERCAAFAAAHGLTERETEVLELLARGRTLKVVAERLTISKGTAGTHIANIYRKCDVHAQQDLIDLFEKFAG